MTWNVRGLNSKTEILKEKIKKEHPHIVVLQETMMWIDADKDL